MRIEVTFATIPYSMVKSWADTAICSCRIRCSLVLSLPCLDDAPATVSNGKHSSLSLQSNQTRDKRAKYQHNTGPRPTSALRWIEELFSRCSDAFQGFSVFYAFRQHGLIGCRSTDNNGICCAFYMHNAARSGNRPFHQQYNLLACWLASTCG
jgi:hypothetical protein